jgi:DNA-binding GntR family transcriptional regulator
MPIDITHDQELDERTRTAWTDYRDAVSDLQGREYDEAETTAWDHLQKVLHEIEEDRAEAPTGGDGVH